VTLIFDL